MDNRELKFQLNNEEVVFNMCRSMKQPNAMSITSVIDVVDEIMLKIPIEGICAIKTLVAVIMNFDGVTMRSMMR